LSVSWSTPRPFGSTEKISSSPWRFEVKKMRSMPATLPHDGSWFRPAAVSWTAGLYGSQSDRPERRRPPQAARDESGRTPGSVEAASLGVQRAKLWLEHEMARPREARNGNDENQECECGGGDADRPDGDGVVG